MNIPLLTIEILSLLALLAMSAFFSSAETSLFSLNTLQITRIRQRSAKAAARIEVLLSSPTRLLSTVLIGNTVVNICSAALGFSILQVLGVRHAEAIAIPAMTLILLLAGEVVPKRLAMQNASQLAPLYSAPLLICIRLLAPARFLLERFSRFFERSLKATAHSSLSEDEFLTVIEVGEEEGVLNEEERTMVDGIIRLEETHASDIMTPRVDLIGIDLADPIEKQMTDIRACRFHLLPLYRETMDRIEGFLDVPRFLLDGGTDITGAAFKPHFVPDNAPLDALLADFQRENRRVAIVSDEFGGTAGLITRGDILEQIADDVDNEFRDRSADIQKIGSDTWIIAGSVSLEDLNYELDLGLEAEGADRIAGWITAQMERIPKVGETTEAQGCRVTIQRVRRQRILTVQLEKLPPPEPPPEEVLP